MAKQINTRVLLKRDTLAAWNASDLLLKAGEVAVAYVETSTKDAHGNIITVPTTLLKAGSKDGDKKFSELPFISAVAADVYDWAKKNDVAIEGTGNVITGASIKNNTLTFEKGETFATQSALQDAINSIEPDTNTTYQFTIPSSGDDAGKLLVEKKEVGETSWTKVTALDFITPDELTTILGGYYTKDEADAKFKTQQTAYSASGSTVKTVTGVTQNANGEIAVTFEDIAFPELPTEDDFGVLSVSGKDAIKVTEGQTPEISLALDNSGNVVLSQSDDGLKAEVDLSNLKTKQTATSVDGATTKTITNVSQNDNGEVTVTYSDIAFPEVPDITITDGTASTPDTATVDVYKNLTANGHALTEELVQVATAKGVATAKSEAIDAAAQDATSKANTAEANAKAYVDAEDIFHTDITTVNALGGIAAGANLDGMTTHEILNTLLFPYVAFVLGNTSRTAAAATLENGATQTLSSASISITKKSKPITSVKLLNGSTVLGEKTGDEVAAGGTITFSNLGITVTKSNNPNLKFTVTDGQTSTDKNVGASTFVYPYYMGECAATDTIDETLIEGLTKKVESKGNKTVTHSCENGRMIIAYPKAHGVLKSILDPNNFETIGDYTRSEVNITGLDGTTQAYYVYASGAATVSGFKVQYKY